jgi:microcystin-dependent protein
MPIAKNGQKNTIPATQAAAGDGLLSQSTGFPPETALPLGAGGKAPTREDFNGAFNLLSDIAFYSQKGWTFQYDETQAYYKGCIVMDATDGLRYECINDVAAGTILPSEDTNNDYWREYFPGGVPLGTILPYSANAAEPPYSFLFCEGQAVSRTMYPDLFALIGTTYGAGDGSTTFNLPNLIGKYPQGDTTAGTVKSAGLPNITGTYITKANVHSTLEQTRGSFSYGTGPNAAQFLTVNSGTANVEHINFDASRSSAIYGNSDTVTPPTLTVRWIIKAYDAPTPSSAQIDLSQYASDLAARLTREQTPAFNKRDVITTSGTYTAPVTGWYKITVKGAGGGGSGGASYSQSGLSGGSGAEGGTSFAWQYFDAGDTVSIVIGAGGTGGAASTTSATTPGGNGGDSSVTFNLTTITGGGGKGASWRGAAGGTGDIVGAPGLSNENSTSNASPGRCGGGAGGGVGGTNDSAGGNGTLGGGGGGGAGVYNAANTAGGKGGDGYAWFEYFDPALM